MRSHRVTIKDEFGMHLRSIMAFVTLAKTFDSQITLKFESEAADGKSPWALLGLGVVPGSQITVCASGCDEDEAVAALVSLAENDFRLPGSEQS